MQKNDGTSKKITKTKTEQRRKENRKFRVSTAINIIKKNNNTALNILFVHHALNMNDFNLYYVVEMKRETPNERKKRKLVFLKYSSHPRVTHKEKMQSILKVFFISFANLDLLSKRTICTFRIVPDPLFHIYLILISIQMETSIMYKYKIYFQTN